ncbi:hypothetical protein C9374_009821 [Naegleria lovaniensis]|uniref:DUF4116 domain-containing protein n=1 Tax=Naegleria lovaniensis TaxID=51637 RepID=A0AA88H411_NAELO|nr:uncharacterized protein C9374_009821 [Naegleria lovaniensis]KAG2393244.1 hypothetical protein C9374_009821 [Naegleria lovaniensis]
MNHPCVQIILMDFSSHHDDSVRFENPNSSHFTICSLENLLKIKFQRQQSGKKKWLKNIELEHRSFIPIEFMNDKVFILDHLKKCRDQNFLYLPRVSLELQKDKEVLWEAIQRCGLELHYAPSELRNEKLFVLTAIKQAYETIMLASQELQNDREFVLEAVQHNGKSLRYVKDQFKGDREIVLAAVKHDAFI